MAKPKADLHIAIPTTPAFPSPQDPITDTCTVDSRFADTCAVDGCSTTTQIQMLAANRRQSIMRVSSSDDIESYVLPFSNTNTNNTISSTMPLHDGYNGEKEIRGIWRGVWGGRITLAWRRLVDRLRAATSAAATSAAATMATAVNVSTAASITNADDNVNAATAATAANAAHISTASCGVPSFAFIAKLFAYVRSKLTWPMTRKVLRAAVAYWLAFLIELILHIFISFIINSTSCLYF